MSNECGYCGRKFAREKTLAVHLCEQKRRHQSKDEPGVRLGFNSFLVFYESTNTGVTKTFGDFTKSSFYKAFVKFGRYCVDSSVINPKQYTLWLLKNNTAIDKWASDALYTTYLQTYIRTENVCDALQRAIKFSVDWQHSQEKQTNNVFKEASSNGIVHSICNGKLSPWVIYNCESGQEFLSVLSSEQVRIIWPYIDSDFWNKKFRDHPNDTQYATMILKEAGW
jgi:hypothetical protein